MSTTGYKVRVCSTTLNARAWFPKRSKDREEKVAKLIPPLPSLVVLLTLGQVIKTKVAGELDVKKAI